MSEHISNVFIVQLQKEISQPKALNAHKMVDCSSYLYTWSHDLVAFESVPKVLHGPLFVQLKSINNANALELMVCFHMKKFVIGFAYEIYEMIQTSYKLLRQRVQWTELTLFWT